MKLQLVKGTTDQILTIFIQDSSSTTGAGLTGLVFNSAGLVCYYVRPGSVAAALTLATQTVTGAHSDGGFVEIDATNMPGWYRLDLSDAIIASGVDSVGVHLKGATNMAPLPLEMQLTDVDLNDSVRAGLTALPNAAADAAGGLPISDAGGLDLDAKIGALTFTVANEVDSNVITKTGFSLAATGLDAIVSTATGMVEIAKAVWDRILSGATHNIAASAGRRMRALQDFQGYSSFIWINTIGGTAGTVPGENGTENSPVLTLADALTLEADVQTPSERLHAANGTILSPVSSLSRFTIIGVEWRLNGGSQEYGLGYIEGADLSGTFLSATGEIAYSNCRFLTVSTGNCLAINPIFTNGLTLTATGDYYFINSRSGKSGVTSPDVTFGAANISANFRDHRGSMTFISMAAGDNCSIDGMGRLITIDSSCTGGTLVIAGMFDLLDNSGGAVTVVDESRYDYDQVRASVWKDTLVTYTDGEAGKRLKGITAVPVDEGTVNDVAATVNTFITTLTGFEDNHFQDALCVVEIAADQWQGRPVLTSNGTTGQIVLSEDLTSAPADGVNIAIQADHIHPVSQIQAGLATSAEISALNDIATSDVLTQVNAALDTAIAELGVGSPTATPSLRTGLMLLYMALRNRIDVDTTGTDALKVHNDAGTQIASKTITDDGADYSEAKMT